jgi:hypothetical protein
MMVVCFVIKIDVLNMESTFQTSYREGEFFFTSHLSTRRGRRNSNINACLFGINIGCMKTRNLKLHCLLILTSNFFLNTFLNLRW